MHNYKKLLLTYSTALIFSSTAAYAQPLNETAPRTQQFTGVRAEPVQRPEAASAEQPLPSNLNNQQSNFKGNRESSAARPIGNLPVQAVKDNSNRSKDKNGDKPNAVNVIPSKTVQAAPQTVQQYNGNRETPRPNPVIVTPSQPIQTSLQAPQQFNGSRETHHHINPSVTVNSAGSLFNGTRAPTNIVQTPSPAAVSLISTPNAGNLPHPHPYNAHQTIGTVAQLARPRPIVNHAPLPQSIIINQRSAVCPYVTLCPSAVAKKGNYIELNDGSVWKVRQRDRNKVKKWNARDAIVIETGGLFSWYSFSLVNYSRRESIEVELHNSDKWHGNTSHWIVEVNPYYGYVKLENGSIWHMSTSELATWSPNDDVIVGLSKDWFSNQYNYVLINPKANSRFTAIFQMN